MIPETLAGRARHLSGQLRCTRSEVLALAVLAAGSLAALVLLWSVARPDQSGVAAAPIGEPDLEISGQEVVVHVAGRVAAPGVYRLPAGSRLADALEAAGGAESGAVLDALNLARLLSDGEQVRVPDASRPVDAEGAAGGHTEAGARRADGTLDLNLASAAELEELPGIGPVMAARVVAHRDEHGPFAVLGDLRGVRGIGEKTFQSLVDHLSL